MEAAKETDTVELVRQLRFFQQAMAILLTADEIDRMKQDCRYYTVDGEKMVETPMHEGQVGQMQEDNMDRTAVVPEESL